MSEELLVRKPPSSFEAEACVLGSILLDSDVICLLDSINSKDFFDKDHRAIFEVMLMIHNEARPVDAVTVKERLSRRGELESMGGLRKLITLGEMVPSPAHVQEYAKIVKDRSMRRDLIKAANKIIQSSYDLGTENPAIEASEQVSEITDAISIGSNRVDIGQTAVEIFEQARESKTDESKALRRKTGTAIFDRVGLGIPKTAFCLIAGRPGWGKTTKSLHIQRRMAMTGWRTSFITMEQPRHEIVANHIAAQSMVARQRILQGMLSKTDWERITQGLTDLTNLPIIIDEAFGFDWPRLKSLIRRQAKVDRSEAIFIDYLQRIKKPRKMNERDFFNEVSWGIKTLCLELEVPIFMLCQLNREIEKEKKRRAPKDSDLKDCGGLEQDADMILFEFPEDAKGQKFVSSESILSKNRGGPTGSINYMWEKDKSAYKEPTVSQIQESLF